MTASRTCAAGEPRLGTSGIFVVHLRSDSDVRQRAIIGRIEHVMSGHSEPFACLADMLEFIARHPLDAPVLTSAVPARPSGASD